MTTATIAPYVNKEVKVKIIFSKEEKKQMIMTQLDTRFVLGVKFAALSEMQKALLLEAAKHSVKSLDTVVIDLDTGEVLNSKFVPQTIGHRSPAMKREDWINSRSSLSKEQAFDNLYNEGEEGYNPYRD